MVHQATQLLHADSLSAGDAEKILTDAGFSDWKRAWERMRRLADSDKAAAALEQCFEPLLIALTDTAQPDTSLVNFERYVQSVVSREELFKYLSQNPRAVEILVRLFVGSRFLTEILLRNPEYLRRLTRSNRLAEFKHREQFVEDANQVIASLDSTAKKLDALRRFQRWEMLRIGACDAFGLLDLKSITLQLSLLADSMVQVCLSLMAADLGIDLSGFVVLGFGKLGGEELNYSSDIDLVFLCDQGADRFWTLGQQLIRALMDSTGEGFLYRVDMRLRPWGHSGALVNTVDAHAKYLHEHGMLWEKQALLKARPIAGDHVTGTKFLSFIQPLIFSLPTDDVRENIRSMKAKIETELDRHGRLWGDVKGGRGSIRDIEFVTQFLQLKYGSELTAIRSANTLSALVRLADFGCLRGDEYRLLSSSYAFLRTIEHSLQLMHYKQTHAFPTDEREQQWLARRLDFPSGDYLVRHYEEHRQAVRRIYDRYILKPEDDRPGNDGGSTVPEHLARMEPSYSEAFSDDDIRQHERMLAGLSDDRIVDVEATCLTGDLRQVTVVGFDSPGELSIICGLLFVYGIDIVQGNVFTDVIARGHGKQSQRQFVNVFTVRPSGELEQDDVWDRYLHDLDELLRTVRSGDVTSAQGSLAKRVARAMRDTPEASSVLYPVDIEVDNNLSDDCTVLHIRSEDTTGFLYELANALASTSIDIVRVDISSTGTRVHDTLYITDTRGRKIDSDDRVQELRTAVVLIKHFTHLLPRSPNPERAMAQFRDFVEQLSRRPGWVEDVASLESDLVLNRLARLLGVSAFLWEDFLRLQHENLFPVVRDVDTLAVRRQRDELDTEIRRAIDAVDSFEEKRGAINAFKDREMFRTDMRHIMGHVDEFGQFSRELTDIAEIVVAAGRELCEQRLRTRFGRPMVDDSDRLSRLAVCALGKCGGYELGFASDIELLFVYESAGTTSGPDRVSNAEYFQKLAEAFTRLIDTRQEGIFQVDLRLRPYGQAGSLAVSYEAFVKYFGANGDAWPYERQALVKLRAIDGDAEFGLEVINSRDSLIYNGDGFDVAAMRAMREKQVRQLVKAGSVNAKLSPGGLVDCEYLVQGLQINHGEHAEAVRATNTRAALAALRDLEVLSSDQWQRLHDAYVFTRLLIDGLRMVRGNAKDLTVPHPDTEEFEFLARRLGYGSDPSRLSQDYERFMADVLELSRLLD